MAEKSEGTSTAEKVVLAVGGMVLLGGAGLVAVSYLNDGKAEAQQRQLQLEMERARLLAAATGQQQKTSSGGGGLLDQLGGVKGIVSLGKELKDLFG